MTSMGKRGMKHMIKGAEGLTGNSTKKNEKNSKKFL
jgi:hypothetical protein